MKSVQDVTLSLRQTGQTQVDLHLPHCSAQSDQRSEVLPMRHMCSVSVFTV